MSETYNNEALSPQARVFGLLENFAEYVAFLLRLNVGVRGVKKPVIVLKRRARVTSNTQHIFTQYRRPFDRLIDNTLNSPMGSME
jgi:hypothetical protein